MSDYCRSATHDVDGGFIAAAVAAPPRRKKRSEFFFDALHHIEKNPSRKKKLGIDPHHTWRAESYALTFSLGG